MSRHPFRDIDFERPHHVYRAFDSYGHLLYVGCSLSVQKRIATHRSGAPWFRFAETISIAGPWSRAEALERERHAIDNEGGYFNCTFADMERTKSNRAVAQKRVTERGHAKPELDLDRWDAEGAAYSEQWESAYLAWDRAVDRERLVLKATTHPYLTDEDRMGRYLAALEDAMNAQREQAAA